MSTGRAQDRLDKLKSRLKTERSNVSVRPEKTSVKSSGIKSRKKDKNALENSSDEKKKKIKELIHQTLNKPAASTQVRTRTLAPANLVIPPQSGNTRSESNGAQTRLKRVIQQNKVEKVTSNTKSHNQSSAIEKKVQQPPSQPPAKYRIPKKVEQPPTEPTYSKALAPNSSKLRLAQMPAQYAHYFAPPAQYSVPPTQYSARPTQNFSLSTQHSALPIQNSARPTQNSAPTTQNSAACSVLTCQTAGGKAPPGHVARASVPIPNQSRAIPKPPKTSNPPPEVQKNLFQRKPPGSGNKQNSTKGQQSCSSNDAKTQNRPYQRPQAKPRPPDNGSSSKVYDWVAKTCKGVVDAVKGTISMGTDRFSAYSTSRPNVSKQLQNVRTLVEPVEMMDYEISCPTFESEQAPLDQTDLHLVIDTNVVLDNLNLIRGLKFRKVKGMTPKIIIPWQVLKELDYLKENKNKFDSMHTNVGARKGIRFLLDEIVQGDGFIGGQPQHIASRDFVDFVVEVPDDHLIKCCLQLKWAGYNVLLLTNDKNLVIKAVVSEVSSMRCDEFSRICHESEESEHRPITCFETPPSGTYTGKQLGNVNAAHRVIILFRGFLSAVLKKFWIYKFHNLWKLRSPGQEPWPLTTLLEIVYETWDEISCSQSQSNSEVILFLRRFIHKMSYERLTYQDLDQLARACHQLAVSLPSSFGVEGTTFDHSLAFLKCTEDSGPAADASFVDCCVSLTVHHFQLFENKAVQYCYSISQNLGIPFNYPKITPAYQSGASINNLHVHMKVVSDVGRSLVRVSASPVGEISKSSEAAQTIYSALIMYLGESADHRFVLQDVVEFCNNPSMRKSFTSALLDLETLSSFLESFDRR